MATKKISELTELTSPDGAEQLVVNDGGTSKKITLTNAVGAVALPIAGGAMTGAITTNSTFDGRDVSADGTQLDDNTVAIALNTAKTGITSVQADAITANTNKATNATHTGDVTGGTALTIEPDAVDIAMLSASGTASSTTFLRGDNTWVEVSGDFAETATLDAYNTTSAITHKLHLGITKH